MLEAWALARSASDRWVGARKAFRTDWQWNQLSKSRLRGLGVLGGRRVLGDRSKVPLADVNGPEPTMTHDKLLA